MVEAGENFDLAQRALAISLVLKRCYFLDGTLMPGLCVHRGNNHPISALPDKLQITIPRTYFEKDSTNDIRHFDSY